MSSRFFMPDRLYLDYVMLIRQTDLEADRFIMCRQVHYVRQVLYGISVHNEIARSI